MNGAEWIAVQVFRTDDLPGTPSFGTSRAHAVLPYLHRTKERTSGDVQRLSGIGTTTVLRALSEAVELRLATRIDRGHSKAPGYLRA